MGQLQNIVKEYKRARENRNDASSRNDLMATSVYNDELTYWAGILDNEMKETGTPLETVRAMLR